MRSMVVNLAPISVGWKVYQNEASASDKKQLAVRYASIRCRPERFMQYSTLTTPSPALPQPEPRPQ